MKNNLFRFATSELSQDAMICWCLNWFNDNSRPRLKEMALSLIHRMAGDIEVVSVDILRQFSERVKLNDGTALTVKVDVLAVINQNIGLIIEDKTFTTVHDDQIYRYVDGISKLLEDGNGMLEHDSNVYRMDPKMLKTVFWKTGFLYDYDQAVKADVKLDGPEIRKLLSPYRKESDILGDYLDQLEEDFCWYKKYGDFTVPHTLESGDKIYDSECYLARLQYPQYRLMRTLFPAERWKKVADSKWEPYQVYHGSSYGRPWTEMNVFRSQYPDSPDKFELFWRIDSDSEGPYLSLRLYESGLKKENRDRHIKKNEECVALMKSVLEDRSLPEEFAWSKVYPGYRGNYKEASIFHLHLKAFLKDWTERCDELVRTIRSINDRYLDKATCHIK